MPAYNFKSCFALAVESGEKNQTIRKRRKVPTKPGDKLMLYTGMRTKQCRLLRETVCTSVDVIEIGDGDYININNQPLKWTEILELVKADGFDNHLEFFEFFRFNYGLPVELELIKWRPLTEVISRLGGAVL